MPGPRTFTDGLAAASAFTWRFRGRRMLTVLVKARFSFTERGPATHLGPAPIALEDRSFGNNPARSIEVASDKIPYRARCDVTLVGHAHAPGGRPVPAVSVRLAILGDGRALLDKVVQVVGDRGPNGAPSSFAKMPLVYERAIGGPGESNPVGIATPNLVDPVDATRPIGLGPISRYWPARKRFAGPHRARIDAAEPELPDDVAWDYFQISPRDQQIEPLVGGEWLVLDGISAEAPRIETQVPHSRGAAILVVVPPDREASARRIALACDGLAVDADTRSFALSFRGSVDVTDEDLTSALVVTALEQENVEVDWAGLIRGALAQRGALSGPAPAAGSSARAEAVGEGTVRMSSDASEQAAQRPVLPFSSEPAVRNKLIVSPAATTWSHDPGAAPAAHARTVPSPEPNLLGSVPQRSMEIGEATRTLGDDEQEALRWRGNAPFGIGLPKTTQTSSVMKPGLPWSPGRMQPVPPAAPGEETLALSNTGPGIAPPARVDGGAAALAEKLQGAGLSSEEIAALLGAVAPPK